MKKREKQLLGILLIVFLLSSIIAGVYMLTNMQDTRADASEVNSQLQIDPCIYCTENQLCKNNECIDIVVKEVELIGPPITIENRCETDSDCIKVSTTCCECYQGGDEIAISSTYKAEYEKQKECSNEMACIDLYNCSDTTPKCINNLCTLESVTEETIEVSEPDTVTESQPLTDTFVSDSGTDEPRSEADSNKTLEKELITGDINSDGKVSLADYSILVNDYISCKDTDICNQRSDLNGDGIVSLGDYSLFMDIYKSL